MKKTIIFFINLIIFFSLTRCSKEAEKPLYRDKYYPDTLRGIPFYWGSFDIKTNIGVNYQGGLGEASKSSYGANFAIMCDSNTFIFGLDISKEPNKQQLTYPHISRWIQLSDIPFKEGKFKIIDIAYWDKKNCAIDTFPRANHYVGLLDGEDLQVLSSYKIGKGLTNFIEITTMDTLNNNISGNFQLNFINEFPSKDKNVPDTVSITCTAFKIPWGKKRK
jgi:hypothetical protein